MRYGELFQFDPIEDVIQLLTAGEEARARELVRTYVISDRMAEQLAAVVIPHLQFLEPHDNKGVLVVGNYGTGKSHLMSVLSAVAEYPGLVSEVKSPAVCRAAQRIAGRFKVARVEIGAVKGSLRDILVKELEAALERWGTPHAFSERDADRSNNKDDILKAVAAFQKRYPDHGILLVVDELLDFLRSREERQLILDLTFLREVGEVAALTPFRFLGGVQETLFDNPRFSFVAGQLRRVHDRFEEVRIAREDIAYVVSHRLLSKTDKQIAIITEHLRPFAPLYGRMAERLTEFAQLYPVHPAYIETFERVYVAEKREVLRTLSHAMAAMVDQEVPQDQPGLISYDQYWGVLRDNPSMRSIPEVGLVIDKSNVLEGRVRNAYTRAHLLPLALRIVHALSVRRLTTSDIHVPLGVTVEELRDDLCLYLPTPEPTADFLRDQVQVALREIMRTASGQYISYNEDNGQYYLDVRKDVDFEAKIAERGLSLGSDEWNRYFYDALVRLLGLSDSTYVSGYRIWPYELPWEQRKVTRPGYLFLGAPEDRSTAQPPRDFYVYFLPPYRGRAWNDEKRADEVIFELTALDESVQEMVRKYAGAKALSEESAEHKGVYATKAEEHLRRLQSWLREHLTGHLRVTYQGKSQPLEQALAQTRSTAAQTTEDLLRLVASHLLAPEFEERYPGYPAFSGLAEPVTEKARADDATEAIRALAGQRRTKLAMAVLEGLKLVDNAGTVRPEASPYAVKLLALLSKKAAGQVVNRGEVIEQVVGGIVTVEKDIFFHLEPEWVAVALVALVYNGDIVLNLGARDALEATNVERAALMAITDLTDFRHYGRPKAMPTGVWIKVFEALGLQSALVRDDKAHDQAVQELQSAVQSELQRTAPLEARLQAGLQLWNSPVFTDCYRIEEEAGIVVRSDRPDVTLSFLDLAPHLRAYKQFLETLSQFNARGKLRNLKLSGPEVSEARNNRQVVDRAAALLDHVGQIQPLTTYLAEARANLPRDHGWSQRADSTRESLLVDVRRFGKGEHARSAAELIREMEDLKKAYITVYAELHARLVLGPKADDSRKKLYKDPRLAGLKTLRDIELLHREELDAWEATLTGLLACREFHEGAIAATPTCPHCRLRPAQLRGDVRGEQVLKELDARLDGMLLSWRQALRANLGSEVAQKSLQAMSSKERKPIERFLAQEESDATIPDGFAASATQALRGIDAVTLPMDGLIEALKAGGLPCTRDELQQRMTRFIDNAMRGHDVRNTRLKLDR